MHAAFLLLIVATTAPSPTATASPAPLKTIITVNSTPFCSLYATHVNAAVGSTLSNDQTLGTLLVTLHNKNLGENEITRRNALDQLAELANTIFKNYHDGESQVNQLRDLEKAAADPREKAELKDVADALGGALYRQHLIQRDLDGFLAYMYAADMMRGGDGENPVPNMTTFEAEGPQEIGGYADRGQLSNAPQLHQGLAGSESYDDDIRYASDTADNFFSRLAPIHGDEIRAAGHIDEVSQRC